MNLGGEYIFDAPQEMVWRALQDPEVLSSVMPGGEDFMGVGENEYEGILNIRVGPVMGKFSGKIKLSDIVEPTSYTISVDGKGTPGFVKATGRMLLSGQNGTTHMSYEGSAQIGGRIASVGQRLMDASAKSIVRQSLEGLNDYLKFQVSAESAAEVAGATGASEDEVTQVQAPAPVSNYKPPSQKSVAVNVAKDVAGDLVPSRYRPIAIGLVAIIIVVILFLILT